MSEIPVALSPVNAHGLGAALGSVAFLLGMKSGSFMNHAVKPAEKKM